MRRAWILKESLKASSNEYQCSSYHTENDCKPANESVYIK